MVTALKILEGLNLAADCSFSARRQGYPASLTYRKRQNGQRALSAITVRGKLDILEPCGGGDILMKKVVMDVDNFFNQQKHLKCVFLGFMSIEF